MYQFAIRRLSNWDVAQYLIFMFISVCMGMFLPYINMMLFSKIIPSGNVGVLLGISCLLATVLIATTLVDIAASLSVSRIHSKIDIAVAPAIYMRLLSLPVSFFKNYSSGELAERSNAIKELNIHHDWCRIFGTFLRIKLASFIYILFCHQYHSHVISPILGSN